MKNSHPKRVDEVSKYYRPAERIESTGKLLFWVTAIISLCIPHSGTFEPSAQIMLKATFIVVVLIYFATAQISRFYLIPKAEKMRRKQLLSDAFNAPLSHDKTQLYYNNQYTPSVQRLGANTMENSLFSSGVAGRMLHKKRLIMGSYLILWLITFTLSHGNLESITWVTQLVFSGEIIAQWLNLEVLRFRHERTFDQLHAHFLHNIGTDNSKAIATVLDCFASYETSKSSAGILLSSKVFNEINPELTKKWEQIRQELKMDHQQDSKSV